MAGARQHQQAEGRARQQGREAARAAILEQTEEQQRRAGEEEEAQALGHGQGDELGIARQRAEADAGGKRRDGRAAGQAPRGGEQEGQRAGTERHLHRQSEATIRRAVLRHVAAGPVADEAGRVLAQPGVEFHHSGEEQRIAGAEEHAGRRDLPAAVHLVEEAVGIDAVMHQVPGRHGVEALVEDIQRPGPRGRADRQQHREAQGEGGPGLEQRGEMASWARHGGQAARPRSASPSR